MSTLDYVQLMLIKILLIILTVYFVMLAVAFLWDKSSQFFPSVYYYLKQRKMIRAFVLWKRDNDDVVMIMTLQGRRVLEKAVDHLRGNHSSTPGFIADEIEREFELTKNSPS